MFTEANPPAGVESVIRAVGLNHRENEPKELVQEGRDLFVFSAITDCVSAHLETVK